MLEIKLVAIKNLRVVYQYLPLNQEKKKKKVICYGNVLELLTQMSEIIHNMVILK